MKGKGPGDDVNVIECAVHYGMERRFGAMLLRFKPLYLFLKKALRSQHATDGVDLANMARNLVHCSFYKILVIFKLKSIP